MLRVMEEALDRGVPPGQVAFVSFTNAAADEARERAKQRFGLSDAELPYFRTLHSLCFREMNLQRGTVFGREHLEELAEVTGELAQPQSYDFEGPMAGKSADPLLTLDSIARMTRRPLRQAWEENQQTGGDVDWHRLKRFTSAYERFRRDRGLVDFTDMLEMYANEAMPPTPVRVAIIDEAQDLTLLQWAVADAAFRDAEEVWAAGDDDQSIHRWAGAAEDHLLNLPYEREVLPLSYRLPRSVFELSREIVSRISRRYAKDTRSTDRPGRVEWVARPEEVDLSSGTWLLLGRTRWKLARLEAEARGQGVLYRVKGEPSASPKHVRAIQAYERLRTGQRIDGEAATSALSAMGVRRDVKETATYTAAELGADFTPIWHDALVRIPLDDREYYLACLRRGEKLTQEPRVRIETIHGAKGAEAENVLLDTEMTYRVKRGYDEEPDAEHRVWYVGVTRALDSLWLMQPRSVYGYGM